MVLCFQKEIFFIELHSLEQYVQHLQITQPSHRLTKHITQDKYVQHLQITQPSHRLTKPTTQEYKRKLKWT